MWTNGERVKRGGLGLVLRRDENRPIAPTQMLGLLEERQAAGVEDTEMGEELGHVLGAVGHEHHRPAFDILGKELAPEKVAVERIEAGERLVEEDQFSVRGEKKRRFDSGQSPLRKRVQAKVKISDVGPCEVLLGTSPIEAGMDAAVEIENVADAEAGGQGGAFPPVRQASVGVPRMPSWIRAEDEEGALREGLAGKCPE
jgi:hypothetical protein